MRMLTLLYSNVKVFIVTLNISMNFVHIGWIYSRQKLYSEMAYFSYM